MQWLTAFWHVRISKDGAPWTLGCTALELNMKTLLLTIIAFVLLALPAWAADDDSDKDSKKDEEKAQSQLQSIGGSYFGTGDEFLYTGIAEDPGAVTPHSVSDGTPDPHHHADNVDYSGTIGEYQPRYDLLYYGQDGTVGPLWGVPATAIPGTGISADDPRALDPHVARAAIDAVQSADHEDLADEGLVVVGETEDGRKIAFRRSAYEFD